MLNMSAPEKDSGSENGSSGKTGSSLAEKVAESGVEFIMPTVTSLVATNRGALVPATACDHLVKHGHQFFAFGHYKMNFNVESLQFKPDPETFLPLPWKPEIGWIRCNLYEEGKPSPQCPRHKLVELQNKAKEMGFFMKTGFEPEFVMLDKDEHKTVDGNSVQDMAVYHHLHLTLQRFDFMSELIKHMTSMGWKPYECEHEGTVGQYEVNYDYADALTSADRFSFFKFMAKELGCKHGCRVSFMPMPFSQSILGSGLHMNVSLWDSNTDTNILPDKDTETGLSTTAQHFIAGILEHTQALTAILCPTFNSYKRLHGGGFTSMIGPPTISWGIGTRYPLIRVLPDCHRMEIRFSDGATNPYLSQAAVLAAGLHGIQNKTPLENSTRLQEDLALERQDHKFMSKFKTMPQSLQESCMYLAQDTALADILGKEIITSYLACKHAEMTESLKVISDYEISMADEY